MVFRGQKGLEGLRIGRFAMDEQYSRTIRLIGEEALSRLKSARVAVFGLGGVGGYAAEALARSGVGQLDLIDSDSVALSNLNRQLIATRSTFGTLKVDAFEARIKDIDPSIAVHKYPIFYLPQTRDQIPFSQFDYIIDAIDTVAAKLDLIQAAADAGVPIISSMGCGNRLDPSKLKVCDISKTAGDPLAKVIRRKLKDLGIKKLKVVCSEELPIKPAPEGSAGAPEAAEDKQPSRHAPASMIFVPAAAGLMLASEVVRDLIKPIQKEV